MDEGVHQLEPEDNPQPAEGTIAPADETQQETPEQPAEGDSTFDPETGNLAQPEATEPLDDDGND